MWAHEARPGLWLVLTDDRPDQPKWIDERDLAERLRRLEQEIAAVDVLALPPGQMVQWLRKQFEMLPPGQRVSTLKRECKRLQAIQTAIERARGKPQSQNKRERGW